MVFNHESLKIIPITEKYYEENLNLLNSVIIESDFLARNTLLTFQDTMNFFKTILPLPGMLYLIALYHDTLIGHVSCIPRSEEKLSHVANIGYIVHANYRKKGVGSCLMEELIKRVKEKNVIKILMAEVAIENVASIKLLEKFQFKKSGQIVKGMLKKPGAFLDILLYAKYLF
ncbi:MAG: GNAT family N-acetyltransferase [Promethearchaeota archaeon]